MKMIVKDQNGNAHEYVVLQAELVDSDTMAYDVREIEPVHNLKAFFKE